jgi:hypothetical protein
VSAVSFTTPLQYRVVADPPVSFVNGYASYFDHTLGTAAGGMQFFDGTVNARIWFDTATLVANTPATFSFWGSSGSPALPPVLGLVVDGVLTGAVLTTQSAQWTQFSNTLTPTSGGLHEEVLVAQSLRLARCREVLRRHVQRCVGQIESAPVHADRALRADVEMDLHRFGRVDVPGAHEPARLAGADCDQRDVEAAVALAVGEADTDVGARDARRATPQAKACSVA